MFPAYVNQPNNEDNKSEAIVEDTSWLSNPSFRVLDSHGDGIKEEPRSSSSEEEPHTSKVERKKKKKKKKHKHRSIKNENNMDELLDRAQDRMVQLLSTDSSYYVDRKGSKNNRLIPTLMKRDVPMYKKPKRIFQEDFTIKIEKKQPKWRYYNCPSKTFDHDEKISENLPSLTNEDIIPVESSETLSTCQNIETNIANTTASFNQQLNEDPHNEELWLKFVKYQDEILQFEKRYHKTNNETFLITADRKLAILDKALSYNPLSESLLFCKFDILNRIHNLDRLSEEIFAALRQDFGNLGLWYRYIQITQCTVSRCKVPNVTSLYVKAMEKIHFMQKYGTLTTEIHLLELFTCCALFLRQCGLWEQLCVLIRLNLQLNLSTSDGEDYKISVNLSNDEIEKLEDEILSCGLPIHALWLRLEKLRQRVHWYPLTDTDCEDPQRLVTVSDVSDLIRPITSSSLNLRIIVISMYLLKVPLIPMRDIVFRSLSLHHILWHLDSGEVLLSAFCSMGITQGSCQNYRESVASCLKDLVSYPQYVNDELGRIEFLEFIHSLFKKISENLPLNIETIVLVWWLRFERTLLIMGSQPMSRKKRLKSLVKDLLKEERHRNNISLFIEYALLERELTHKNESCLKILETALFLQPLKKQMFHYSPMKNTITELYRTLAEILLTSGKKEKSLRLLVSLTSGIPEQEVVVDDQAVKATLMEFQRVTDELLREDYLSDEFDLQHLEPQFFVEWIHCQAWFVYLTEDIWLACSFLDEILTRLPRYEEDKLITLDMYYRELLLEIRITLLHHHCEVEKTSYMTFKDNLQKAIAESPNNARFLCTLFELESKSNFTSAWYKIDSCLRSNDSHLAKLILILLCHKRLMFYEKASVCAFESNSSAAGIADSLSNRMKSLLYSISRDEVTRQCPLIWCIYLQYCAKYEVETKCKDVYFMGVENCPWVKALYMEAAHALPEQISQIQDLLVEKEIRIHITQDEIDILRSS